MKAIEVFTPGTLPTHTYYDREQLRLEWRLLEAIETPGMIVSISGPSKSGKTVLCERVIGQKKMVLVTGGGITQEEFFWRKLRQKLKLPIQQSKTESRAISSEVGTKASAEAQIPFVFTGQGELSASLGSERGSTASHAFDNFDGAHLLDHLREAGYALVVDDFHYIAKSVQRSLAEHFKEAVRTGGMIAVISVSHRSDEAIRANPDLRGRVVSVDIPFWTPQELKEIGLRGLPLLGLDPAEDLLNRFSKESLTSPQLMQAICLQYCRLVGRDEASNEPAKKLLNRDDIEALFRQTASLANCQTAFDVIVTGPKPRGTERNDYLMTNGHKGDVYQVILRALVLDPPMSTFPYADLKGRIEKIVPNEPPRGVGITQALAQMHKVVVERLGEDRVLEWDDEKQTLNLPDPYFLYFLRWSEW